MSRRVITISKKKWGKTATKTEKIIRDAVPKPEVLTGINEYLGKARSVTCYDVANRFNVRMSVARRILREKEAKGELIPYIRESGFVVYTTRSEMEKRQGGVPVMIADALAEVASSVPERPVITEEMDEALAAAATLGAVKPSQLARKRREAGERKERKDMRPEVVVEPLAIAEHPRIPITEPESMRKALEKKVEVLEDKEEHPEKVAEKKEEQPKKEVKKVSEEKKEKPKKVAKKDTEKKAVTPKKETKKAIDKKTEKPKKDTKRVAEKKIEKPTKETKKAPEKMAEKPKKDTKKAAEKKTENPKKETKKQSLLE